MWYVRAFYTIRSLSLFFLGKFVIYIICAVVIITLHLYFICICVDMFMHNITVSVFICLCMKYNLIIDCTFSWGFCSICLLFMSYSTNVLLLHMCWY